MPETDDALWDALADPRNRIRSVTKNSAGRWKVHFFSGLTGPAMLDPREAVRRALARPDEPAVTSPA